MVHILLLDDEAELREEVADYLRGLKYYVTEAASLRELNAHLRLNTYDIVILDRMLPDGDSLELVDDLRTTLPNCGVVMFTARDSSKDRIQGYLQGADHYLTKPVRLDELAAIIATLARRIHRENNWHLNATEWVIVSPQNRQIQLTSLEHAFLTVLAKTPNKVLSRRHILDALGKSISSYDPRNLDSLVLRLRKKVQDTTDEPLPLKTVHGVGYCLSRPLSIH
jgi:DNA-binding response OmpR family regulator